jgi:hypothetical protein
MLWARHDVQETTRGRMRVNHPLVGQLNLDWDAYPMSGDSGQVLIVYTAPTPPRRAARTTNASICSGHCSKHPPRPRCPSRNPDTVRRGYGIGDRAIANGLNRDISAEGQLVCATLGFGSATPYGQQVCVRGDVYANHTAGPSSFGVTRGGGRRAFPTRATSPSGPVASVPITHIFDGNSKSGRAWPRHVAATMGGQYGRGGATREPG